MKESSKKKSKARRRKKLTEKRESGKGDQYFWESEPTWVRENAHL